VFYVAGWFYAIVLAGFGEVQYGPFPSEEACWKDRSYEVRAGKQVGVCFESYAEHGLS
jgi:hypothetical protein